MSISVLIAPDFILPPALEAGWLKKLPRSRSAEVARWADRRARHRSLLASRLLSEGLQRWGYTGDVLASLHYPLRARPTLDLAVDFSVSHCDGRVLCALSTSGPIGVDVEAIGDLNADEFRVYLNAAERTWAGTSAHRFYSVWTRKEAVVKAAGTVGLPVVREVDTMSGERRAGFAGQTWCTTEIPVGERHVAHLALRDAGTAVSFEQISMCHLERDIPPQ